MNLTGKHLLRFWAALRSDLETLQGKFLEGTSFLYEEFCKHVRESKFLLVLNTAIGKGKFKDEHYALMMTLMLDVARDVWLGGGNAVNAVAPYNPKISKHVRDETLVFKRQVFGCYLIYSLWINQPFIDDDRVRVRIKMDAQDIRTLRLFIETYLDHPQLESSVRIGLAGMIGTFMVKDAFQYTLDSKEFGIELWKRILLTNMKSELTMKILEMREVQDHLVYSAACRNGGANLKEMQACKNTMTEMMSKSVIHEVYDTFQKSDDAILDPLRSSFAMSEVTFLNDAVKNIVKQPVLTIEHLTAQETAPRVILAETRRRMQRSRKRLLEEPKSSKSPYVGQGGTFGRKKELGGKEGGERRERGMCSGNLWTYISGNTFDRPLGHLPATNTETPSADTTATESEKISA